ncbi:odorant receptor 47a-like [Polistes fuscatus]|uniref:odorant receptor 47a-like n=1 Tax=Polistes fuscatus TaxID=30207 RepID=UPI001CA98F27|nr:odorant receptor 47a-like [Polistes fuscatus]
MGKKPWNDEVAYAMTFYKFLTLPTGVWPLQNYNFFSIVRSVVTVGCQIFMLIFQFKELLDGCNDGHANLDSLTIIACNIMAIIKIACYRYHSRHLIDNYKSAIKDYSESKSLEDLAIMKRHAFIGRSLCSILICFSYLATSIFMVAPFFMSIEDTTINGTKTSLPKTLSYPMPSDCTLGSFNVSIGLYCFISALDIVLLISTCNGNLGNDCLFFGITLHVCGQVEILKTQFTRFKFQKGMKQKFSHLLSRYSELLTLAEYLVNTISIVLVAQLLVSCILICIIGFQCILALHYSDIFMFAKSLTVLSTFLLQLLIYSYVGEYLRNQMEQVGYAAYGSAWYDFPISWRKDLIFLLMRSQQLVEIAAGYFFPVNMRTFMSIVKTSLSYLSVITRNTFLWK